MTTNQIKRILSSLKQTSDTWIKPQEIVQIYLSIDANIPLSPNIYTNNTEISENDRMYFDTENELFLLKRYSPKRLVSSRFNEKCLISNSNITFKKNIFPGKTYKNNVISSPEIGDLIFTVDPKTLKQQEQTFISNISFLDGEVKLEFEKTLNTSEKIVCWAKKDLYLNAEANSNDESVLFLSKPINSLPFNTAIDFKYLEGFALRRFSYGKK